MILDLEKYGNVLCGVYSGGNKRKLNLALALVGLPLIQLLDEPTTGVDPCSRRKIWNMINSSKLNTRKMSNNKDVQPSILLTSHSMDECEVLCDEYVFFLFINDNAFLIFKIVIFYCF